MIARAGGAYGERIYAVADVSRRGGKEAVRWSQVKRSDRIRDENNGTGAAGG